MFADLVSLFSGWYLSFVETIRDTLQLTNDGVVTNPEIWSAYVPWEYLIAAVVLCVFVICIFRLIRSFVCRIL